METMTNKSQVTIIGASHVDFVTDDNKHLDFIKLHVLMPLDTSRGDKFGFGVSTFNLEPGSKHLRTFEHADYPMDGELHWQSISDGKQGTKMQALDFTPKAVVTPATKANAA